MTVNKRGQVTIFIILAVILVAVVAGFFIFRGTITKKIPADMQPIYNNFLSCLEDDALTGINILESQAGYIELPDFEPGSVYMPFSSQLNFLGNPIPYWYYISGNNIEKEQVPSKNDMEKELEDFIDEKIKGCVLDYEDYSISLGEPGSNVDISDNSVDVSLDVDLEISRDEESVLIRNHKVTVKSNFGKLYQSAREIYKKEQEELFLENYGVDVLRLYAPVDGIELSCSPKTWNADEVFGEIKEAIELNTFALRTQGNSRDYFVIKGINEDARFINSGVWANTFEVNPSEGNMLVAEPVGNQAGLGILGFCYVPYHFVYNVKYPVLIQVYEDEEIFQFPVAVVIQGNKPREALAGSAVEAELPEICGYKNTLMKINVYDSELNRVAADISYECFGVTCEIGESSSTGQFEEKFPQCVNGYVIAKAEGFEDTKYLQSVIDSETVSMTMDRIYEINVALKLDGQSYNGNAIINFVSDEVSKTVVYPEQKKVELSEGEYEVQVYVYENTSIKIEATTQEQCVEVPQSGLRGLFGATAQKCFEIEIPAQIISNALAGGGKDVYYISESELKNSDYIEINAGSLELPTTIQELQGNYLLFETKGVDINFG